MALREQTLEILGRLNVYGVTSGAPEDDLLAVMWAHQAIEVAIESIQSAPFLSDEQKRDILINYAARFLRLSPTVTEAMHRGR